MKTVYLFLIFGSTLTHAAQAPMNNLSASGLPYEVNCDTFCASFKKVGKDAKSQLSSSAWNPDDDALCNNIGSPTASTNTTPEDRDENWPDKKCPGVRMTASVLAQVQSYPTDQEKCSHAGTLRDMCTYHNSQLEPYCWSYNAASINQGPAYAADATLLVFDLATAATCAGACYFANPVAAGFCGAMDIMAGAGEIAATLAMTQNPVNEYIEKGSMKATDYISAISGGVGAIAGGVTIGSAVNLRNAQKSSQGAQDAGDAAKTAATSSNEMTDQKHLDILKDGADKLKKNIAANEEALKTVQDESLKKGIENKIGKDKQTLDGLDKQIQKETTELKSADDAKNAKNAEDVADAKNAAKETDELQNAKKFERAMACGTAFLYTAMAGVRTYDLIAIKLSANAACDGVKGVYSQLLASQGGGGSGGGSNGTQTGSGGGSNGSDATSGGDPGAHASVGTLQTFNDCMRSSQGNSYSTCASQAGISMDPAMDGNVVTKSPLAGQLLNQVPDIGALAKMATDKGAAAALGSMLPDGGAGDSSALLGLAKLAQDNAANLGLGNASTYTGGGGGGGGGGKSDNPLAALFGNNAGSAAGGAERGLATFGSPGSPSDIWHTGTNMNLFEIVSGKISKVTPRVITKQF